MRTYKYLDYYFGRYNDSNFRKNMFPSYTQLKIKKCDFGHPVAKKYSTDYYDITILFLIINNSYTLF